MADVDYVDGEFFFESDQRCHDFTPNRTSGQYTKFTDLYGRGVTVRYSSLATSAAVWIFTTPSESQRRDLLRAGLAPELFGGAAHLCRAMAREVRDALNKFLDEPVEEPLACETRTPRKIIMSDAVESVDSLMVDGSGQQHGLGPADL